MDSQLITSITFKNYKIPILARMQQPVSKQKL